MTDDVYFWQSARRLWHQLEPVFAPFFYAPEVFEEAAALGYATETRWPTYFPFRAAPLGAAGPRLVTATFYSFSPAMVAEHVEPAWRIAEPAQVLEARVRGVDRMYRTLMADQLGTPGLVEAAALVRRAAESADTVGRPLAAATADLPWPDEPHLVLWQAISLLREHRGDGHIATLVDHDLDGCEALVSFAAIGAAPAETFGSRQWSDEEWQAAPSGCGRGGSWTPTARPPTRAGTCATGSSAEPMNWPPPPGGSSRRPTSTGWSNSTSPS